MIAHPHRTEINHLHLQPNISGGNMSKRAPCRGSRTKGPGGETLAVGEVRDAQSSMLPKSLCHPIHCATQVDVPPTSLHHGASLGAYPKTSLCLRARTCSPSPKTPHENGSKAKPTRDAPKASCPPNPRFSPTRARCVRGRRACRGRGRTERRDPQPLLGAGRRRSPSVAPAQAEASDGPAAALPLASV